MAFYSSFTGERGVYIWATCMNILKDLGSIDIKEGASGPIGYVLVLNPFPVILTHRRAGRIQDRPFNALTERPIEIGTDDLIGSIPERGQAAQRLATCDGENADGWG